MLLPLDREKLRLEFASATPFPYIKIDNLLMPEAAKEAAASYPDFETALEQGKTFATVNERKKIQITNSALFPKPVAQLNQLLSSPSFLEDISFITGIPNLLSDEELIGGGIHMTGPGGKLDVHVDFNFIAERQLYRRLNLLLYLNARWETSWGGQFQLWDKDVKICSATFDPVLNRCIIFETSDISYHGVVPVGLAAGGPRKSFAAYYYTREAPPHWTGQEHSTVFVARPDERYKKYVLMPYEKMRAGFKIGARRLKAAAKSLMLGRGSPLR